MKELDPALYSLNNEHDRINDYISSPKRSVCPALNHTRNTNKEHCEEKMKSIKCERYQVKLDLLQLRLNLVLQRTPN